MSNPPKSRRPSFGLGEALRPEEGEGAKDLDLTGFEPQPARERPPLDEIRKTSEQARFPSREAAPVSAPLPVVPTRPAPTPLVQLNVKIPLEVDADITTLMQRTGWRKVDTIKRSVALLKQVSDIADATGLDLEKTIERALQAVRAATEKR